jgi:hypothetical protein
VLLLLLLLVLLLRVKLRLLPAWSVIAVIMLMVRH